jgi:hypothetical protein
MTQTYTSHWSSGLLPDLDATIVGISRGTPRRSPGFRYRLMRSLAPSDATWALEDLGEFEASYVEQLRRLGAEKIVDDLARIAGDRPAVLLCWERLADPDEYCHRRTLAGFLEREAGIVVPELTAGDMPRRPDSPQVSLFESYREDRK